MGLLSPDLRVNSPNLIQLAERSPLARNFCDEVSSVMDDPLSIEHQRSNFQDSFNRKSIFSVTF